MGASIFLRTKEHRGCGIRAASYTAGPDSWIPDACVLLLTDAGSIRIWVRSFAHCFDNENVSFRNKLEADNWAFDAARAIIDRALPEFDAITWSRVPLCSNPMTKVLDMARRWLGVFRRIGIRVQAG